MVRFLCHVGPGREAERAYLSALVAAGLHVRVVPINFADYTGGMGDWAEHAEQLVAEMPEDEPFVNVVCSADDSDFVKMYTVGVTNMAVVLGDVEVYTVLRQYDFVVGDDVEVLKRLLANGAKGAYVPAAQHEGLGMIVRELHELAQKRRRGE